MFSLNQQIQADSELVLKLSLSQVRILNNAHFVWLLLVPEVSNAVELIDLDASQQQQLLAEVNQLSHILKAHFPCDKLNIAMIGNKVSQLHVHLIVRRKDDICWPEPVWGGPKIAYTEEAIADTITKISQALKSK